MKREKKIVNCGILTNVFAAGLFLMYARWRECSLKNHHSTFAYTDMNLIIWIITEPRKKRRVDGLTGIYRSFLSLVLFSLASFFFSSCSHDSLTFFSTSLKSSYADYHWSVFADLLNISFNFHISSSFPIYLIIIIIFSF